MVQWEKKTSRTDDIHGGYGSQSRHSNQMHFVSIEEHHINFRFDSSHAWSGTQTAAVDEGWRRKKHNNIRSFSKRVEMTVDNTF